MVDFVLIENAQIGTVDTITPLYTSPPDGQGTVITAWSATNNSTISSSVSYRAYIVSAGGTIIGPIIPLTIVVRDRFHAGPSATNQVVPPGGSIQAENSQINGLLFYATGREQ